MQLLNKRGSCNFSFLKNSLVQINSKLNEKNRMITYTKYLRCHHLFNKFRDELRVGNRTRIRKNINIKPGLFKKRNQQCKLKAVWKNSLI